jgi:arylsulfatase A-like enzyme
LWSSSPTISVTAIRIVTTTTRKSPRRTSIAWPRRAWRFSDAHTPCAVCTPTRYGLLTGRYCWRTSLKSGVLNGYSPFLIEPKRLTLASLLKQRGYVTAGFGKWHLGLGDAAKTDFSKQLRPGPCSVREAIVHSSGDGALAIRQGPWKLALALGSHGFSAPRTIQPKAGEPQGRLYNLDDDPREQQNLWLEKPAIVKRLTALLDKYQREGRSRPR